jgi:transposase
MADESIIERLEKRISEMERRLHESETRLRHVEAARRNLTREVQSLREENRVLKEKVKDLTARLGLNSSNSWMPPSSDRPWQRQRPKWKPTGRRPGGQPGHEAHAREPFKPEDVDHVVPVFPERCANCSRGLCDRDNAGLPHSHHVVDLPPTAAEVTQYELGHRVCPGCGTVTQAELPQGVSWCMVGVRLQAVLAFLTGRCRLSRREAREIVAALFGWKALFSLGMVATLEQRTSAALARAYEDALFAVQGSPFVNADETSWTESRKPAWLWTAATPLLKVFRVDPRRNTEAFRRLLFDFDGVLITDRWSVYRAHDPDFRQLCWAHILRNFKGLVERGGAAKKLGVDGQEAVAAIFWWWYRYRDGEITRLGLRRGLAPVRARFRWLLGRNQDNADSKARAMAVDLLEYEQCLWTFARVEGIEPTNNAAERAIRKAVLWRKGSFGSASPAGSRFVERMLTVTESLRAQGRSILDFIEQSIRAGLSGQPHPSLLPARAA